MNSYHNQAELVLSSGKKIYCDEKILPLIKKLNDAGFKTNYSCHGDRNNVSYVTMDYEKNNDYSIADDIIKKFWRRKHFINIDFVPANKISWYALNKEQCQRHIINRGY